MYDSVDLVINIYLYLQVLIEIKKSKFEDEAKYRVYCVDEGGKDLDFAGFSIFVKGQFENLRVIEYIVGCLILRR